MWSAINLYSLYAKSQHNVCLYFNLFKKTINLLNSHSIRHIYLSKTLKFENMKNKPSRWRGPRLLGGADTQTSRGCVWSGCCCRGPARRRRSSYDTCSRLCAASAETAAASAGRRRLGASSRRLLTRGESYLLWISMIL